MHHVAGQPDPAKVNFYISLDRMHVPILIIKHDSMVLEVYFMCPKTVSVTL
jgi:hypothetical protein